MRQKYNALFHILATLKYETYVDISCTNFHCGEKAKAMRLQLPTIYNIHLLFFVFKVQGDDGQLPTNPSVTPALRNYHVQNSFAQGD